MTLATTCPATHRTHLPLRMTLATTCPTYESPGVGERLPRTPQTSHQASQSLSRASQSLGRSSQYCSPTVPLRSTAQEHAPLRITLACHQTFAIEATSPTVQLRTRLPSGSRLLATWPSPLKLHAPSGQASPQDDAHPSMSRLPSGQGSTHALTTHARPQGSTLHARPQASTHALKTSLPTCPLRTSLPSV